MGQDELWSTNHGQIAQHNTTRIRHTEQQGCTTAGVAVCRDPQILAELKLAKGTKEDPHGGNDLSDELMYMAHTRQT